MKFKMRVKVNTRLRIRTGPGLSFSYSDVDYLHDGDEIIAIEESNNWFKHGKGWSYGEFLEFIEDLDPKMPIVPVDVNEMQKQESKKYIDENSYNVDYSEMNSTKSNASSRTMLNLPEKTRAALRSQGVYDRKDIDVFNKINRFGYREFDGIRTVREYLFFTKPDLNIINNVGINPELNDTFIHELYERQPEVLYQLQNSLPDSSPFINLLYNKVRNRMDLPTVNAKEIETNATQFGTKLYYRKHSFTSDENHDFSLEFEDTKDLYVYNFFKAYDIYCNMKSVGLVTVTDNYRDNRELHDQISIFKFVVDETNGRILYYAKAIGVMIKKVPREVFSDLNELKYSIDFKANFVEDLDPLIIRDFNMLSSRLNGGELPLYDIKNDRINGDWAGSAYIEKAEFANKKGFYYKLKWRR